MININNMHGCIDIGEKYILQYIVTHERQLGNYQNSFSAVY